MASISTVKAPVTITPALPEDADSLAGVAQYSTAKNSRLLQSREAWVEFFQGWLGAQSNNQRCIVYKAIRAMGRPDANGSYVRLAGYAIIKQPRQRRYYELLSFGVHPVHRRLGVGRQIIEKALRHIEESATPVLRHYLHPDDADIGAFLGYCGFEFCGVLPHAFGKNKPGHLMQCRRGPSCGKP